MTLQIRDLTEERHDSKFSKFRMLHHCPPIAKALNTLNLKALLLQGVDSE